MVRRTQKEEIIRLASLLDRLRAMTRDVEAKLDLLLDGTGASASDNAAEALLAEGRETTHSVATRVAREKQGRKSMFPEGPPLNRKVLAFLKKVGRPCGYQDVLEEVEANHQSIQNALRDLEKRGYVVRLAPNEWIAPENTGKRGALKAVE